LHFGHIMPLGQAGLLADDPPDAQGQGRYAKGQISYVRDDYGVRIFRYYRNAKLSAGASLQGGLYSRSADVNVTLSAENPRTTSTTTKIFKSGASWTPNTLLGRMYVHIGNVTSAGAAPEGETAIVIGNTADTVSLDPLRPLSVPPSVGADTTRVISLFDVAASAASDLAAPGSTVPNVMGIAMAALGSGDWGMFQTYGLCPDAKVQPSQSAPMGPGPIAAHIEQVTAAPATTLVSYRLVIGWIPYAIAAANASGFGTVFINVHSPALPIASL
jgi:hypothetical protein